MRIGGEVQLRYNFRLYPTVGQQQALARTFGCARVVWNDALARQRPIKAANRMLGSPAHRLAEGPWQRIPKNIDLAKELITAAKRTPERAWLSSAPVGVLSQSLRDLDKAWSTYEASKSGKRKGPKIAEPRFKSKRDNHQSVRYIRSDGFRITANDKLMIPKIGKVAVRWSRRLPSAPSSVTVIKDASGRYFASFVVMTDGAEVLSEVDGEVGIDLGLTHFAVLDDGTKVAAPQFLRRAARKLRKAQRILCRKQKGSQNRKKAAARVAKAHAKVADARRDHHHKLSTTIVRENQLIAVEDLPVAGLGRTRLAKSIHDAGWSQFVGMLEYKATRYGRTLVKVDRWFPSSQVCSDCGFRDGPKPLAVRKWTCGNCGGQHDRDVNAARNIRQEGKRNVAAGQADTLNGRGAQVRPGLVPAQRSEAATHRSAILSARQPALGGAAGIPRQ